MVKQHDKMIRQRGQTSLDIRQLILKHFQDGKSVRDIAKMVNRSHSTVHDIIKRSKTSSTVENRPRAYTRKIFNESDERWIINQLKKNPKLSAPKLAVEVKKHLGKEANPETIRIVLRKYGINGRAAQRKPLTNKQIKIKIKIKKIADLRV